MRVATLGGFANPPDFKDLILSEFVPVIILAFGLPIVSTFHFPIAVVVLNGSKETVVGPHTLTVVALVQHPQWIRNWSIGKLPSQPMSVFQFVVINAVGVTPDIQPAVTLGIAVSCPNPTGTKFREFNRDWAVVIYLFPYAVEKAFVNLSDVGHRRNSLPLAG